jgi:MFS family permease
VSRFGLPPLDVFPREHRILVLIIGLATMFSGFDTAIFGLAAARILPEFGLTIEDQGATSALFRLGIFGAIALGFIADLRGRRSVLMITIAGMSAGTLLSGLAPNYWTFVAAQFVVRVFGFAEDFLGVVVVAEEVDARVRGWALGVVGAMGALGAALAVLCYAAVPFLPGDWRALYVLGGLALIFVAWLRRALPETRRFADREKPTIASLGDALRPFAILFRQHAKRVLLMIGLVAPFAMSAAPTYGLFASFLQRERGFVPVEVAALTLIGAAAAVILGTLAGRLADRWGRKPVIVLALAAGAIGWPIVYLVPSHWAIFAGILPAIFCQFTGTVMIEALGAEIFPTSVRATATSIRFLTLVMSGAISLVLHSAWAAPIFGFGAGALVFIALGPLGLIPLYFLPETARRDLDEIAPEHAYAGP